MAHSLIIGQTESGKSVLAKMLARGLAGAGRELVILDPLASQDWPTGPKVVQVRTADRCDVELRARRNAFFFVDECGLIFEHGRDNRYQHWATLSRHYGHSGYFIAQRVIMVPTTMRTQCKRLYVFHTYASDGRILYEEWGKPELLTLHNLPPLDFYEVDRYNPAQRFRIKEYARVQVVKGGSRHDHSTPLPSSGSHDDRSGGGTVDSQTGETE